MTKKSLLWKIIENTKIAVGLESDLYSRGSTVTLNGLDKIMNMMKISIECKNALGDKIDTWLFKPDVKKELQTLGIYDQVNAEQISGVVAGFISGLIMQQKLEEQFVIENTKI